MRSSPFFFRHSTKLLVNGDFDFLMIPASNSCCRWSLTSLYIDGGMRRCLCLNGVGSISSMLCSTDVTCPMSLLFHEKMSLFLLKNDFTSSYCDGVRLSVAILS